MSTTDIQFKLHTIKTEQFAIIDDVSINSDPITLDSNYRFGAIGAERIVTVVVNYKFKTPKGVFLIIEVSCMFDIKPESWNSIINNEKLSLILPKEIATHLLVLTIGTTRGILHAKTENTLYNRYFVPTLNVSNSIQEDIVISWR
jgi:hypothetical protein